MKRMMTLGLLAVALSSATMVSTPANAAFWDSIRNWWDNTFGGGTASYGPMPGWGPNSQYPLRQHILDNNRGIWYQHRADTHNNGATCTGSYDAHVNGMCNLPGMLPQNW